MIDGEVETVFGCGSIVNQLKLNDNVIVIFRSAPGISGLVNLDIQTIGRIPALNEAIISQIAINGIRILLGIDAVPPVCSTHRPEWFAIGVSRPAQGIGAHRNLRRIRIVITAHCIPLFGLDSPGLNHISGDADKYADLPDGIMIGAYWPASLRQNPVGEAEELSQIGNHLTKLINVKHIFSSIFNP